MQTRNDKNSKEPSNILWTFFFPAPLELTQHFFRARSENTFRKWLGNLQTTERKRTNSSFFFLPLTAKEKVHMLFVTFSHHFSLVNNNKFNALNNFHHSNDLRQCSRCSLFLSPFPNIWTSNQRTVKQIEKCEVFSTSIKFLSFMKQKYL